MTRVALHLLLGALITALFLVLLVPRSLLGLVVFVLLKASDLLLRPLQWTDRQAQRLTAWWATRSIALNAPEAP